MLQGKTKEITFIHKDGKEYTFKAEVNTLNGAWMFTYNNWRQCFAGTLRDINSIIKDIRKKTKVLSETENNNPKGQRKLNEFKREEKDAA